MKKGDKMKKKSVSLFLALILSLVLTIPALAADQSTENLSTYISFVRNGLLDEVTKQYVIKSTPKWMYSIDGTSVQSEEYYTPFSQDDTWVLTNVAREYCHIYLTCTYLPWDVWNVASGPVGLYNADKFSVWCKPGKFVDSNSIDSYADLAILIGPGESTSFSANDFILPEDDGTMQILYILQIMFLFPGNSEDDFIGLQMLFMRDEAGTAKCILKAMQTGAGIISPSTSESPLSHSNFADVSVNSPYRDAIDWAVTQSITKGVTPTTFCPSNNCTVSQILTFLWRAAGGPEILDDEKAAVLYLANKLGADPNNLDAPCTRAMAMTYIWKAVDSPAPTSTTAFVDVPVSAEYAQAVAWAVENGITSGTSANTFSPDSICTRGQIVTFLYRTLQ